MIFESNRKAFENPDETEKHFIAEICVDALESVAVIRDVNSWEIS